MADPQKLVLMVQVTRLQGLIWQSVLKSQRIGVIWEAPDTDLVENLDQLKAAGLTLPDLLLVDMQIPNFNPYAFCRWCREQYPGVKVILTNSAQTEVTLSERQWAVNQGASDLFSGFHHENVVGGVAAAAKRLLEILDDHPLNNGALIAVLLRIKRELESRMAPAKSQVYLSERKETSGEPARRNSLPASSQPFSGNAIAFPENGKNGNGKNGNGKKPAEIQPSLAPDYDKGSTDSGSTLISIVETPQKVATLEGIYGMSSIQPSPKRWSPSKPDPDVQLISDRAPTADSNSSTDDFLVTASPSPTDSTLVNGQGSSPAPSPAPTAPRKRLLYYRGVCHS